MLERHPHDPTITREPDGIWGEAELPVSEWEVPTERRVVPRDIVEIMDARSPIALVDVGTANKQARKHRNSIQQWTAFDGTIQNWQMQRKQPPGESRPSAFDRWQFVQIIVDDETPPDWPLLTVLERQPDGTIKIITSHRRRPSYLEVFTNLPGVRNREEK